MSDAFAEVLRIRDEAIAELARAAEQIEHGDRCTGDRRRDRVRKEIRTRPLPQDRDDLLLAGREATCGAAERLAEGRRHHVDALRDAEVLGRAAPRLADEAARVRV